MAELTTRPYSVNLSQQPGHWWYAAEVVTDGHRSRSDALCVTVSGGTNGVAVGRPKIYDQRGLQAQIQDLIAVLSASKFPDPSALFGAVGQFQGGTASSSAQALSLTTIPTPGVVDTTGITNTIGSGNTTSLSETVELPSAATHIVTRVEPDGSTTVQTTTDQAIATGSTTTSSGTTDSTETSDTSQRVVTTPSVSGTVPALPSQISPFSFQPTFGFAPQDTLQRQTELEYRLVNLRMLLERSLTDRLLRGSEDGKSYPRSQPVIGFDVSVDPLPRATTSPATLARMWRMSSRTSSVTMATSRCPTEHRLVWRSTSLRRTTSGN